MRYAAFSEIVIICSLFCTTQVFTGGGVDLDSLTLVDEQRHLDLSAGLNSSGLQGVGSSVASEAGLGLGNDQLNKVGNFNAEDAALVAQNGADIVLLDELEGITELEAAVKIISSFIEMIEESNSFAIIVTHMANELMKYTDIRVDGIEATGLDENYNLIVDRTPKMHYLAKSTPELIIKRMYNNSPPELKKVYGKILEKF